MVEGYNQNLAGGEGLLCLRLGQAGARSPGGVLF